MLLNLKKINLKYPIIFALAVFAGVLISFHGLSVLFLLFSILFVLISFKYFNQVLLLLILYIPFQVALNISAGIDLASGRVLILYMFAVWIIKSLAEKRFVIRLNLQTLLIGIFLMLALFSILQAQDAERAIRKILVFLSIFPLYFILTSLLNKVGIGHCPIPTIVNGLDVVENKNNFILKTIKMLVIGGVIISLIGIIQFVLQFILGINPIMEFWSKYISPLFYGNTFGAEVISNPSWLVNIGGATVLRAFSLFPDPHMFSFYLGLIIPIVLAIVLVDSRWLHCGDSPVEPKCRPFARWLHSPKGTMELAKPHNDKPFLNKKLLYFILIIMLLAELFTLSRGGYIGMIAGVGVLIILSWKYISTSKKTVIGLLFSVFLFVIFFTNQSIANRFISSFDFNEGSNTERLKNWNQGYEMFANNFLFGVGIGNYSLEINPTIEYRSPVYAHNLYLDIGAEMGIFALVVWLLLIGTTIWQLYKVSKKTEDNFFRALSLGLIGSLVWFSAHSFFDTPIYSPTILAIFTVIISLSVMTIAGKKCDKKSDF